MTTPQYLLLVRQGATPQFVDSDAGHPHLSVLDVGATRGDGIFETLSVSRGLPQALEAHLDRFSRSARMLDLPEPDRALWRQAVRALAEHLADHDEAWIKTVMTRGIEGQSQPTGWAYGTVSPDFHRQRTDGISVVLLDRGLRSDVSITSPWLLAGAKTLSYAVNRAAVREAERRGADDVIFVSTDGVLLEGPTSTLIVRRGSELVTPPYALGILPGTTQADLFDTARQWGLTTTVQPLSTADLIAADAAWLVSSVRHAAPICRIDNAPVVVDQHLTRAMNTFLQARRS